VFLSTPPPITNPIQSHLGVETQAVTSSSPCRGLPPFRHRAAVAVQLTLTVFQQDCFRKEITALNSVRPLETVLEREDIHVLVLEGVIHHTQ
jgi:hypothetical protein